MKRTRAEAGQEACEWKNRAISSTTRRRNSSSRHSTLLGVIYLALDVNMRLLASSLPPTTFYRQSLRHLSPIRTRDSLVKSPYFLLTSSQSALASSTSSSSPPATESLLARTSCERIFDLDLPEGRCVGLSLPKLPEDDPQALSRQALMNPNHWVYSVLHPREVAFAQAQPSDNGRQTFLLGRLALREALGPTSVSLEDCLLKDKHGRPYVPKGFLGSISHKRTTAVALVRAHDEDASATLGIGIDVEEALANKSNIARKVLTKREMERLGRVEGLTPEEEVLLRFSLKESLYKAMHPLICQYVGFQEVEIEPNADGSALVSFHLKSGAHERFGVVNSHWRRVSDYFLSSTSVRLKEGVAVEPCEI